VTVVVTHRVLRHRDRPPGRMVLRAAHGARQRRGWRSAAKQRRRTWPWCKQRSNKASGALNLAAVSVHYPIFQTDLHSLQKEWRRILARQRRQQAVRPHQLCSLPTRRISEHPKDAAETSPSEPDRQGTARAFRQTGPLRAPKCDETNGRVHLLPPAQAQRGPGRAGFRAAPARSVGNARA